MDSYIFADDSTPEARRIRRFWYALLALASVQCLATIAVAAIYRQERAAWDTIVFPIMGSFKYTAAAFWLLGACTYGYMLAARRQFNAAHATENPIA